MQVSWFVIARSDSDEAIQSFTGLDCFAEFIIGPAKPDPLARNDDVGLTACS